MKNCWEAKECGREPGGVQSASTGVCPAALESRLDGVHNGRNAGRACWVVAGTMCGGTIAGTYAMKYDTCAKCEFYQRVKREESPAFTLSPLLLNLLKGKSALP